MEKTLDEKLREIEKVITSEDFREMKGLSNEVAYYIFDYPPVEELKVRKYLKELEEKFKTIPQGFELKIYDLYDIMVDFIEEESLLDDCIEMEENHGMDYLINSVYELLNMDSNDNYFTNYIIENTPDNSVIFITGVGKIYPFLRAHGVLNKLLEIFDKVPIVLFYPGKYDGLNLMLFSLFNDEHYYRALPLIR